MTQEHIDSTKLKSSPTTQLVSWIVLSDGRTLSYEYDAEERITKLTDSFDGITEYTYDALGQLLTETHNGTVVNSMTYDNYGNILSKNGKVYTYGDPTWKDLLTSFDGQSIIYDNQGNPTSYLGHTLTWEKGRQLKSWTDTIHNITYTYNAKGIRTGKTVNGVKHTYELEGTKILREVCGNYTLTPLYDNQNSVCGIMYNSTPYYFLKNLQNDVIAITNKEGEVVARYSYDAWGKCTIVEGMAFDIAAFNPYRYRSYYYDVETGLYYLQSRYYDPEVARFLTTDKIIKYGSNTTTFNLYVYCGNNPVCRYDAEGMLFKSVVNFASSIVDEALHLGNDALLLIGIDTAEIGAYFLNMNKIGNTYHADVDCWQQNFGYNSIYDWLFDFGTDMLSENFKFNSGGKSYCIWVWKGDYINLGAGAELGIYTGGGPHWYVDTSLSMPMELKVRHNGEEIISYSDTTWWITGFNPASEHLNANAEDISATYIINFSSKLNLYYAFRDIYGKNNSDWKFDNCKFKAKLTF